MSPRASLGTQLRATVTAAFAEQAAAHGAALHRRAVEIRSRDPLATFLSDTFARQVCGFGQRALQARQDGDRARALELAGAALRAEDNLARVAAAVEGTGGDLSPGR